MPDTSHSARTQYDLSIVIVCRNEQGAIAHCVNEARGFLERNGIDGEVLVVDNGSSDSSAKLASRAGARVISEPAPGYGNAVMAGVESARGHLIIQGDGDGEHDLGALEAYYEKLRDGYDFVFGNRFADGRKASTPLRNAGTTFLSAMGRLLVRSPVADVNCGLRGFRASSVRAIGLRCAGWDSPIETIIKAVKADMRIAEVAIVQRSALDPERVSHLRAWRDGWRILRFLLMFSPRWLYLYPGGLLLAAGAVALVGPIVYPDEAGGDYGTYTILFGAAFLICGLQLVILALLATVFYENIGVLERRWSARLQRDRVLNGTLATGLVMMLLGAAGSIWSLLLWAQADGPGLDVRMRVAIPSITLLICGLQLTFTQFMFALLTTQGNPARGRTGAARTDH